MFSLRDRQDCPGVGATTWLLPLALLGTIVSLIVAPFVDPAVDVHAAGGPVALLIGQITGAIALGPGQSRFLWAASGVCGVLLVIHVTLLIAHVFGLRVSDLFNRPPKPTTTTGDADTTGDDEDRVL